MSFLHFKIIRTRQQWMDIIDALLTMDKTPYEFWDRIELEGRISWNLGFEPHGDSLQINNLSLKELRMVYWAERQIQWK